MFKNVNMQVSQRLFILALAMVSLLVGALLGSPGEYAPTGDGSYLTPELVLEKIAPLVGLLGVGFYLFKSIQTRIDDGNLNPGDVLALLKTEEFWIAAAGLVAAVVEMFGGQILDEGTQSMIVTVGLGLMTLVLRDYGQRTAGADSQGARPQRINSSPGYDREEAAFMGFTDKEAPK